MGFGITHEIGDKLAAAVVCAFVLLQSRAGQFARQAVDSEPLTAGAYTYHAQRRQASDGFIQSREIVTEGGSLSQSGTRGIRDKERERRQRSPPIIAQLPQLKRPIEYALGRIASAVSQTVRLPNTPAISRTASAASVVLPTPEIEPAALRFHKALNERVSGRSRGIVCCRIGLKRTAHDDDSGEIGQVLPAEVGPSCKERY